MNLNFLKQLLFVDSTTGKVSHTKFFACCGYASIIWVFLHLPYVQITSEFVLLYAGAVIGNHSILSLARQKIPNRKDSEGEPK